MTIFKFSALFTFCLTLTAPVFSASENALLAPENVSALEYEAARNPVDAALRLQAGFDGAAGLPKPGESVLPVFPDIRGREQSPVVLQELKADSGDFAPPAVSGGGTLVLIQIDGLSYNRLQEAISKGYAGNIAEMIKNKGFVASPYFCGVPTVTMSIQSQMFFNRKLPGNEWFSKTRNKEVTGAIVEEGLPSNAGLLHKGRAFLSELSGGAQKGANVRVWIDKDSEKYGGFWSKIREIGRSIPYLVRGMKFPGITFWKEWRQMKKDFAEKNYETETDKYAPVYISMLNNFAASVATEGLKKAIIEEAPSVYADFSGYDEKAHYYGYSSDQAFTELDRIDKNIGEIMETARKYGGRVFVFSDHGQTPSETFVGKFGKKPQDFLDELGKQTDSMYKNGDLVFSQVYSMGNIYLKNVSGHAGAAEIKKNHPGIIEKLVSHQGVGMAALRDSGGIILISKNGRAVISAAGYSSEGNDPLAPYLDARMSRDILAAQIKDYLELEESGDIVIFAPYENGKTIDYNIKYTLISEHGGIGGEQMHPFIIYDPRIAPVNPESFFDARGLNGIFKSLLK
ncbi:MAG: alkaline phosphatase family protein [Elusimicrobia bacterium]|nr:alkaline phosphatase family protein [Elusimicrobiota bacterium]